MKTVHLMGIGGSGMTSLAGMFRELGWNVRGSDQKVYPPASDLLASLNISVMEGYHADNLVPSPDLVVVGNVISRSNPEAQALLASEIPYLSMPQALCEYVLKDRASVVVSGTHGKSTSSSLMSWLLEEGGANPGFFVGGVPKNFGSGFRVGKGKYFVFEGDEYDTAFFEKTPKFLHYQPKHVILTSVEFDHADIYRDLDHVMEQFIRLLDILPKEGCVIACGDDENVRKVCETGSSAPILFYGIQEINEWQARNVQTTEKGTAFDVFFKQKFETHLESSLIGRHNVSNVLACYAMGRDLGFSASKLSHGVETFKGVRRRQEFLGEVKGVQFFDDFAHHPTAISETLKGFIPRAKMRKGRLWAVLEPRSNTLRRKVFQEVLPQSLAFADEIVIAPVFQKQDSLDALDQLDPKALVKTLEKERKSAYAPNDHEELLSFVLSKVKKGDVVVFMSNGSFSDVPRKTLRRLEQT